MQIPRRTILIGSVVALAGLSGCSGKGSSTLPGTSASPSAGGSAGLQALKVAVMPIADLGAFYYAVDSGLFKKNGLDVQPVDATGGSAAIASMMSGDVDLAYSGTDGAIKAAANGLTVKIISGAGANRPTGPKDSAGFVAAKGIKSPKDLAGKTVATMALGNVNQVYAQKWLKAEGVDPSSVKFVEIPSNEQVAAMAKGQIQGSIMPEPFASQALANGATILGWPWRTGGDSTTLVSVYTASEASIAKNTPQIKKFLAAMGDADTFANNPANRSTIVAAILKHTKLESKVANNMTFVTWTSKADPAKIKEVADTLVEFGVLKSKPDVDKMIDTSFAS